ncbi:MAG: gliding motility-associated C-terminal domain-containing protein [Fluviicola sp.]
MKMILRSILVILGLFFISDAIAQRAKDGSYTVTGATEVLNTYTNLTVNANAGNTSISVASNAMTGGAFGATPLQQGDLILIVQMHGASVDVNFFPVIAGWGDYTWPQSYFDVGFGTTPETFGQITNYNNSGRYERVEVLSTSGGNTINLTCGLTYNYTAADEVQIVRIPRFDDLTVNNGAAIVPTLWDGVSGGVVALEVDGTLTINTGGTITASGFGFRGGQVDNDFIPGAANTGGSGADRFLGSPNGDFGSEKGESIHGYHVEYDAIYSRYGVSGIANGGGGGSYVNAGGGGGSNAEVAAGAFNARGNPVAGYAAAYGQDPTITASSGAGQGGYALSQSNQNANFTGPNNAAWGGDGRKNAGGWGGHPLAYDAGRIFFGGGGGAGDQDSGEGGSGGRGGGIVYIVNYGTIAGGGAIEANGEAGQNTNPTNQPLGFNAYRGNDGAGGGGGAGTVYIENATAIPGTIGIDANGGDGGNQNLQVNTFQQNEAGGPGGAGSGGIIRYSSGAPATSVVSGNAGTTTSTHLTEFPPNGATNGSSGDALNTAPYYDLIPNDVTICAGQTATPSVTVNGSYTGTLNWYLTQYGGSPIAGQTNQLTYNVSPATTTTYWVGVCPGTFRVPVTVTVTPSPTLVTTDPAPVCAPNTVDITLPAVTAGSDPGTLTYWQDNGATVSQTTPTAVGAGWHYIVLDVGGGCTALDSVFVTVNPQDDASFTSGDYCEGGTNTISGVATPGGNFSIQSQTGSGGVTIDPSTGILSNGVAGDQITIEYTTTGPCPNSSTQVVNVLPLDDASFTSSDFCASSVNTISGVATPGGTFSIASQTGSGGVTIDPSTGVLSNYFAGDQVTIQYTTTGPCPNSSTVVVNVTNLDDPSFTSGDFCVSSVNTISGVATPGGTFSIASQTGSGGVTIDPSTGILSNYFTGDQVTIQYTTPAGGCQNSSTVVVNVTGLDDASFSSGDYCQGSSNTISGVVTPGGTFTIQSQTGSGSVTIDGSTGVLSGGVAGDQITIEYTTPAGGCQNSSTQVVNILPLDDATFVSNDFCASTTNTISGVATPGGTFSILSQTGSGGATIDPSTGILSGFASGDQVTIEYTTPAGGCQNSSTQVVNVTPLPVISTAQTPISACNANDGEITVSDAGNATGVVNWTGPTSGSSGSVTLPFTFSSLPPGTYDVTFTDNTTGCTSLIAQETLINPNAPVIDPISTLSDCDSIQLPPITGTDLTGSEAYYDGTGGTGTMYNAGDWISSSTTLYAYDASGTCTDEESFNVVIETIPVAAFTANPTAGCAIPHTVFFTDNSTLPDTWFWDFGDANTSTAQNPVHNYTTFGTFTVTLTVTDTINGCSDQATTTITVSTAPVLDPQGPITGCDSIQLPPITGTGLTGNEAYYSGTGGTGTQYAAGDWISTSMTMYINDTSNPCTTEESFVITVNPSPTISGPTSVCPGASIVLSGTGTPDGTTPWTSSNTGVATVDNAGNVTGVSAGSTTITYLDANGCSDTYVVSVTSAPVLDPIANVTGCDSIQLAPITGTGLTGNEAYYSGTGGTGTQYAAGDWISSSMTMYANDVSNPCTVEQSFAITVNPSPTISGGSTFCESSVLVLSGTGTPDPVTPWSSSNTAVATVDNTGNVSGVSAGTTDITYTDNNGCSNTITVTVNATPTISGNAPICAGATNTLTGSGTPDPTTPWTSSDATVATIDNAGVVTAVGAGTTTITYLEVNGCSTTDVVTVNAAPNLTITDPAAVCDPSTVDLTDPAVTAGSDPGTLTYWTDNMATVTLTTPNSVSTTNTYYIQLDDGNCTTIQPVNVTVNPQPTLTLTDPAAVCDPNLVDLTDPSVSAGSDPGALTYFDGMGNAVATPSTVSSGTYFITLTDANGCQSTGQVTATVNPSPTLVVTDPAAVCEPNIVDLTASAVTAGSDPGTLTYWTDAGATATLTTPGAVNNGIYYIQLENGNGCSSIEAVNATVNPLDDATFFMTPTCDGATATITGTSGGAFTLLTASSATIDGSNGTITGASYNETLDVEYTTSGTCPNSSVEIVTVDDCTPEDLIIPTAFTPGADGAHDTWEIVGLDNLYPNNRVTVYNRWGNKVFEHNASSVDPYSNNMWDGTFNGAQLPVASYYYIIETNDASSTEKFEGTVTILQ